LNDQRLHEDSDKRGENRQPFPRLTLPFRMHGKPL
jgi:hypothetical protein